MTKVLLTCGHTMTTEKTEIMLTAKRQHKPPVFFCTECRHRRIVRATVTDLPETSETTND